MIPDPFIRVPTGADALVEGYYLFQRRRAERVDMPVRIWFGPPLDENGEELDRSPRWQVMICGTLLDDKPFWIGGMLIESLADLWPKCGAEPIDQVEYEFRIARADWAAEYDPNDPFGTPAGKIDPLTASLPFI